MTIPKISNDFESKRMTKNQTETQKRNTNNVKEGKIVNSFVKDPNLSLDETIDTLVISKQSVDLPSKLYEMEEKKNNSLYLLSAVSVGVMSLIAGFTSFVKKSSKKHYNSTKEFLLPGITRNHCINNEIHQSIFSMIQSPNRKTILASLGVITLASMAFLTKTFVDGYKDIWVKKREADIQKNLQENLIEVETQSFSGKMQIIRSMLSEKAKEFEKGLNDSKDLNFKSEKMFIKNDKNENKSLILGISTILATIGVGYLSLKNIRKSENFVKNGVENTKSAIEKLIKDFNEGIAIDGLKNDEGKKLTGIEAYKFLIGNMLESIYASSETIDYYIEKLNLSSSEKEILKKELKFSMNQATEKVNSAIGGSGRNKITYFSHVNDYLSFFYDWLMNPKNPQFKNLFIGITGISALAYGGKTVSEAIKEVEVKKYNAETELSLQKRLVSTELRNFKAKKESVIEPLCEEFYKQKKEGKSAEELKLIADNILFEIKNGAPFVYS